MLVAILALLAITVYYQLKLRSVRDKIHVLSVEEAKRLFDAWRRSELEEAKRSIEESLRRSLEAEFEKWRLSEEERIREDAVKRSLSTILGKVGEELAPLILFSSLNIEPKDLRHLGSPVDYVAFRGLSRGVVEEIVFIEIKTSDAPRLSEIEREVKRAVEEKRVSFVVLNVREELEKIRGKTS
jgi:predicted Holliday junction resolvase-like endonuclease